MIRPGDRVRLLRDIRRMPGGHDPKFRGTTRTHELYAVKGEEGIVIKELPMSESNARSFQVQMGNQIKTFRITSLEKVRP